MNTEIQWNLSNRDTLGTKIVTEVSIFQGENKYMLGTQSSVLINQGVLISEVSFKIFHCIVTDLKFTWQYMLCSLLQCGTYEM